MLILCDAPPPSLLLLLLLIFDVDNIFYSRAVEIIPCDGSETIVVLVLPTQILDLVERKMGNVRSPPTRSIFGVDQNVKVVISLVAYTLYIKKTSGLNKRPKTVLIT